MRVNFLNYTCNCIDEDMSYVAILRDKNENHITGASTRISDRLPRCDLKPTNVTINTWYSKLNIFMI